MRRATLLLSAVIAAPWGAAAQPAPAPAPDAAPERAPRVSARSRIYLRLDPSTVPDPDGRIEPAALGSFRVVARGEWDAEASGWIAHAPGSASFAEDALSGDVTTLLLARDFGAVELTLGRQWTPIGGQRLDALDGATATVHLDERLEVSARAGVGGLEPRKPYGDTPTFGGEARFEPIDHTRFSLGVVHAMPDEAPVRTRWTATGGYDMGSLFRAIAAATADVGARAVVDARLELTLRPTEGLWVRGYARHTRVDLLLEPDELLAVFVEDLRDEFGGLVEWLAVSWVRLRLDAAAVYSEDRVGGTRVRGGVDFYPIAGATVIAEGTLRLDRVGRSGTARLATRWPLWRTLFGTIETLGDLDVDGEPAALARGGLGFEPFDGWFAYGAVEAAHTPRWPERLGGLVLLEHAFGAPVRWGGGP
ncbi:MAG: hypothetical protein H6704_10760 [Myxococcales bacterium]|nr:hypothetical protein [Myxococcales bacterium]